MLTQNASATFTCTSHPIIPPDGTDNAIGAITATEADPACFGLGAWVSPSNYDSMPTTFSARDAIQVFLPDADRPASSAYKAQIQAESGTSFTTVNATCSTGTVYSNNTTVVAVELADGASCALTATATLTGEVVTYQATLARSGDKYTLANGIASGGNFDRPEISLGSTETSFIPDAGTDSWSNAVAGVAKTVTYTISNFGYADLILTGSSATHVASSNVLSALYSNYSATTISQGAGTATFDVTLTPIAVGAFTQSFTVISNDVDEATFDITISGTAVAPPELDIRNNADNADITDGSTTISSALGTDFGNVGVGSNASNTFRAENNGTATLTFDADALSISNTTDFSITSDLTNSGTVASSGVETFTIQFNPASSGTKTATVTIDSDDANEDPYTFLIQGVGVDSTPPAVQTISVDGSPAADATSFDFIVTFDEDVVNVTADDFTLDASSSDVTATIGTPVAIATGTQWRVPMTNVIGTGGTISIDLNASTDIADSAPNSGPAAFTAGATHTVTQTAPTISINDVTQAEGDTGSSNFTFTVSLSKAWTQTITVDYVTATSSAPSATAGSDYTAVGSTTLTFNPLDTSETLNVAVAGDAIVETDERFLVNLSNATNVNFISDSQGIGTLTNDDQATITIADVSVNENSGTATITVVTDLAVDGLFQVDVSTTDGTATTADGDYTAVSSQTILFTGGAAAESETFTVTLGGDTKVEADETINISMSNINPQAVAASDIIITDTATLTITNDDQATLTIADVAVNENSGTATITVVSDLVVDGGFSVDVSTSDGTATTADGDYTAVTSQTETFAGTAGETETVTVTIANDTNVESDETFTVSMSNLAGATGITISDTATVTITNDDIAPRVTSIERRIPTTETTSSDVLVWRVTFSEDVTGVDMTDFSVSGTTATVVGLSTVSASVYDVNVSGGDLANLNATVTLSVLATGSDNIENLSGVDFTNTTPTGTNNNTFIVQNDVTAPSIASIERNAPTTETTDADTLIWRVTFDEDVTGVDTSDFSVSGTTATVSGVSAVSASVYDVTVSGGDLADLNATVTLTALTGGGNIEDLVGNDFANATPTGTNDNTFIVSNTISTTVLTLNSDEGGDIPDGGTDAQGDEQIGAPKTVTYIFTNQGTTPITFTGAAPIVSGSSNAGTPVASNFSQTTLAPGNTTTFTVTYTPDAAGAFSIDLDIPTSTGTFDVAVSGTAVDTIAPSVAINGAPESHDNASSFNVTFEFSEDVTGFVIGDITLANGTASNFVAVDGNTYTADITPSGSLNVTIDVAGSVAVDSGSNGNTAATQVIVKGSIVEDTQRTIADFMTNRANNILSNQPDMIGFVNGSNNGGGGPLGNLQLNSDLDSETTMSFYTSRSKILAVRNADSSGKGNRPAPADEIPLFASAERFGATDETLADSDTLNAAETTDEEQLAAQSYNGTDRTGTWDIWTQVKGSKSTQPNVKSEFWSANFGTHYFVSNDVLVGMLTQFDWAEEINSSANSTVSGNGFLVGPYIAGKVKDQNLYYEARALWGRSSNDITPIGTYTDSFETERWLASLKVQGSYDLDDQTVVKPEVSISYFEETQEAYTDTNSNLIPEQTISLGEFKFGPTITRSFDAGSGFTMRASVGVSGITNFSVDNANTSTSNAFANQDLRARVDAGIELENEYGIRFTAAGFYDGIGASNFQSYGGTLGLVIPLN